MGFNPLGVPRWDSVLPKARPVPLVRWKAAEPSGTPPPPVSRAVPYLSREEELAKAAKEADQTITVEIKSVQGHPGGIFILPWEGGALGAYLAKMEVKHLAINNAVYDKTNLEKGRLRMTYHPAPDAHILIGSAALGPNSHMQRSNGDPRPKKGAPLEEQISMRYGPAPVEKKGLDDVGIDQF